MYLHLIHYGLLFQHNNMQRLLIILGIVLIPFYEILLRALPFVRCVAPDSRAPKEIISLILALSIGLLAVWYGNIKTFKNKFFLIIPVYLLFNLMISPHANLIINNVECGDFYFWKPFSEVLCFSLMIIAISSMDINFEEILRIMVFCGFGMSIYVILQKLGMDQFWLPREGIFYDQVRGRLMGGNLGQPTIVASWIIMMIPLGMYLKKYWMVVAMIVACILTQGAMVMIALGLIWLISVFKLYRELRIIIILFLILFGIFSCINLIRNPLLRDKITTRMDGRYEVWKDTLKDIHNGQIKDGQKFGITGIGFGRFAFSFPTKNNIPFQQTHNDPLQFMYDCGLVGEYLLLAGIFTMIFIASTHATPIVFSILLSFIGIFICSLGSFPFQLGAHQFYASILVGLLHNDSLIRRV